MGKSLRLPAMAFKLLPMLFEALHSGLCLFDLCQILRRFDTISQNGTSTLEDFNFLQLKLFLVLLLFITPLAKTAAGFLLPVMAIAAVILS